MKRKRLPRDSDAEIRRRYREILGQPRLSDREVDRLRVPVRLLAQAICEHVWKKQVF